MYAHDEVSTSTQHKNKHINVDVHATMVLPDSHLRVGASTREQRSVYRAHVQRMYRLCVLRLPTTFVRVLAQAHHGHVWLDDASMHPQNITFCIDPTAEDSAWLHGYTRVRPHTSVHTRDTRFNTHIHTAHTWDHTAWRGSTM